MLPRVCAACCCRPRPRLCVGSGNVKNTHVLSGQRDHVRPRTPRHTPRRALFVTLASWLVTWSWSLSLLLLLLLLTLLYSTAAATTYVFCCAGRPLSRATPRLRSTSATCTTRVRRLAGLGRQWGLLLLCLFIHESLAFLFPLFYFLYFSWCLPPPPPPHPSISFFGSFDVHLSPTLTLSPTLRLPHPSSSSRSPSFSGRFGRGSGPHRGRGVVRAGRRARAPRRRRRA